MHSNKEEFGAVPMMRKNCAVNFTRCKEITFTGSNHTMTNSLLAVEDVYIGVYRATANNQCCQGSSRNVYMCIIQV